jgi:phosphate transport system substrate-binding protein
MKHLFGRTAIIAMLLLSLLVGCAPAEQSPTPEGGDTPAKPELIQVITREEGSGTRSAFVELSGVEQKDASGTKMDHTTVEATTSNSTSVVLATVMQGPAAIGYVSMGSLSDGVKALDVEGVKATAENVQNGSYKLARPFNIATKGEVSAQTEDFIRFILSNQGQVIAEETGYVAIEAQGDYEAAGASGKIVVSGSSSVTPVMEKLKEAYVALNPDVNIEVQQSDSTTGRTNAIDGICDIGMASREVKDSELEKGLDATVIAMDGIAVIVHPENSVPGLTMEQIKDIFVGTITDWNEVK